MRFAICALLTITSINFAAETEKEFQVDSVSRKAIIYLPKDSSKAAPVVFAFHGHGGTMQHAARTFAYQTHWPEAIVVYMQGLNTPGKLTDPEGKKSGWQSGPGDQQDRDLKFFDVVLASLKKDYKVDEKRIYATGHSNGGGFTYLLWATRGDVFAAFGPSAAFSIKAASQLKPKPMIHVAGKADPLVKFDFQEKMINFVKKLDQCEESGKDWDKAGNLVGTEYVGKTGNNVVTLIHPDDHTFHKEAPKLITKFFKSQVKK